MKKITKILAIVLALLMILPALAACKNNEKPTNDPNASKAPQGSNDPGTTTEKEYTYRLVMGATPDTWNPHTWETNADSEMMSYIEGIPVDVTMGESGYFEWVYEMLTGVTDVTSTWDQAQNWLEADEDGNYPQDGDGYIYKLDLNPDAKWQDGTPINADTYIYSMERCISSEMKNYRANSYTTSESAIKNALGYYQNDLTGEVIYTDAATQDAEGNITYAEADAYYVNYKTACFFFGDSIENVEANYGSYFVLEDGTDIIKTLFQRETDDKQGYIKVTDEDIANLTTVAAAFDCDYENAWKEFCFVDSGEKFAETPWEDVGLIKGDEYTIYYVLEEPESMFYFLTSLTSGWIVNKELYEKGYKQVNDLLTTDYGTGVDNYSASGPYKLVSFEADKAFVFEKNENWYGWTDGKHEGQYQTTKIHYDIVKDQTTQLMMFNQGSLDEVSLTADDMTKYRTADRLLKTDQTYTYRYIFATDLEALKTLEQEAGDGFNKTLLAYDEFRQGISLAINRQELCTDCTPGYKPAYYLLNSLYYYNIENDAESRYRDTDEAKEAVLRVYGIEYGEGKEYATLDEAYQSVTGYDVQKAHDLIQTAVDKAIEDGNYTAGQKINITCAATAGGLTTDYNNECEHLNAYIAAATEGIENIGEVVITYRGNVENRYADVATGKIEMARGAWGGAAFYPFSTIRVYCEPDYMGGDTAIHEACGFKPRVETIDIPIDGEIMTRTYQQWAQSINGAGDFAGDDQVQNKLLILSYLESNLISGAHMIPIACDAVVSMYSFKIEYATTEYDIMYGYGGIRLMKYNYSDDEWEKFVADQGGTLDYT